MKTSFKNRKGKKIVVQIDPEKSTKRLTFIAHGLGGYKEQPWIQTITETYLENGFTVVRWDAANAMGESEGNVELATLTDYYEDFEDVINWAKLQDWYIEPFSLSGHSLGSACAILFTEKFPDKISSIAPISAFLSGRSYHEFKKDELKDWKEKGYKIEISKSKPGAKKKISWLFMIDVLKYELINLAKRINTPTLLIVGSEDQAAPYKDQKKFFDILDTNQKELHIIEGAEHVFKGKEQLNKVKSLLSKFLMKNERI